MLPEIIKKILKNYTNLVQHCLCPYSQNFKNKEFYFPDFTFN